MVVCAYLCLGPVTFKGVKEVTKRGFQLLGVVGGWREGYWVLASGWYRLVFLLQLLAASVPALTYQSAADISPLCEASPLWCVCDRNC